MIYLDNAATSYPKSEGVYRALDKANRYMAFNAGRGSYKVAREATKLVDDTKKKLLRLVRAEGVGKVIFTPSITIALNEILHGIELHEGDNVYISPFEHNAVARVVQLLKVTKKINVIQMPLKSESLEIDLGKLQYCFSQHKPNIVCCIHVSNVTGYVLPVKEIFDAAKTYNAITILDTAQSLGLIEINTFEMNLDFLAFAGHKTLYGPLGIGGFIDLKGTPLIPVIAGGTGSNSLNLDMPEESPYKYETASLNIVSVAGLNEALNEIDISTNSKKEQELLDYLLEKIHGVDNIVLYCPPRDKHISILSFNIEGFKAEDIGEILDADFDIAVRTGYHCAPYIHDYIGGKRFNGTVRIGLGKFTTPKEIDALIEALKNINE